MKNLVLTLILFVPALIIAQSNMSLSNGQALDLLKANYNPQSYAASNVINGHDRIICELQDRVSPDSIKHYLEELEGFGTRHTFSDTTSSTEGIGAARRWVYSKFQSFSNRNESRLVTSYLVFDVIGNTCGNLLGTKNVLAILPGSDTSNKDIIIIEGHMDSRCEDRCDTACPAPGADDNGSGTALVIELARVMSKYTFNRTIVFMATTGEEQGLLGAEAMALFAVNNNIGIRAVQNNDVVGGVICGQTSSPPGCSPPDAIDSLNLRIYSNPISHLYPHQSFARTVKMYYEEKLYPNANVQMTINVMNQEDRTGRGGDHIPFREQGFRNLRFTCAHEHGDANATAPGYEDRQHTSNDVLGADTDGDMIVDSFYVDFNYLSRNTVINGMTATLVAQGPDVPNFILHNEPGGLRVEVTSPLASEYRLGVRDGTQPEFNDVYSFTGNSMVVPDQVNGSFYYVSVAAIDSNGVMSPFTMDKRDFCPANTPAGTPATLKYGINCNLFGSFERPVKEASKAVEILGNQPNPFSDNTTIIIRVNDLPSKDSARLVITDQSGRTMAEIPVNLQYGENTIEYHHKGSSGLLICTLKIGEQLIDSVKMIVE